MRGIATASRRSSRASFALGPSDCRSKMAVHERSPASLPHATPAGGSPGDVPRGLVDCARVLPIVVRCRRLPCFVRSPGLTASAFRPSGADEVALARTPPSSRYASPIGITKAPGCGPLPRSSTRIEANQTRSTRSRSFVGEANRRDGKPSPADPRGCVPLESISDPAELFGKCEYCVSLRFRDRAVRVSTLVDLDFGKYVGRRTLVRVVIHGISLRYRRLVSAILEPASAATVTPRPPPQEDSAGTARPQIRQRTFHQCIHPIGGSTTRADEFANGQYRSGTADRARSTRSSTSVHGQAATTGTPHRDARSAIRAPTRTLTRARPRCSPWRGSRAR